jgi:zinc and cadmium transporter
MLLAIYCAIVAAASLMGGLVPALARISHTHVQLAMSFVGGLMLGVAVLHLLPHAASQAESLDLAAQSALLGLVATFLLIRFLAVHQHGHHDPIVHVHGDADHVHEHPGETPRRLANGSPASRSGDLDGGVRRHRWLGLLVGLSLHTVIDGMALAASIAAESPAHDGVVLAGVGTLLAITLHKPMDSLSVTTVMVADGVSKRLVHVVNGFFALLCPLAAIVFYLGLYGAQYTSWLLGCGLGFAAGSFLCIALADILPEIQFHAHDRLKLTAALLAGVALAYGIGFLEPRHVHGQSHFDAFLTGPLDRFGAVQAPPGG